MLGKQKNDSDLFQLVTMEDLVPVGHLLRKLNAALDLSAVVAKVTSRYAKIGRHSYDPEVIARIWILQHLHNLSEREVCDELQMHAGFRWFCGMSFNDPVPDQSTLVKLRTQKWEGTDFWQELLNETVRACEAAGICKPERMAVDGTLIAANAAMSSLEETRPELNLSESTATGDPSTASAEPSRTDPEPPSLTVEEGGRPQGGHKSGDPDWHGERFSNDTHRSTTDPEARLYTKGSHQETRLRYTGHYLADVKSGVIYGAMATQSTGTAEREAALALLDDLTTRPNELVADLGYRDGGFLAEVIDRGVQPLVAIGDEPLESIPTYSRRTYDLMRLAERKKRQRAARARNQTRQASRGRRGVRAQRERTRIEHLFAEAKMQHGLTRASGRGVERVDQQVKLTAAVQNLKRLLSTRGRRRTADEATIEHLGLLAAHLTFPTLQGRHVRRLRGTTTNSCRTRCRHLQPRRQPRSSSDF